MFRGHTSILFALFVAILGGALAANGSLNVTALDCGFRRLVFHPLNTRC